SFLVRCRQVPRRGRGPSRADRRRLLSRREPLFSCRRLEDSSVFHKSARYRSFYLAVAAGVAAALITLLIAPAQAVLWGSNICFALYLALSLTMFPRASVEFLQKHAD